MMALAKMGTRIETAERDVLALWEGDCRGLPGANAVRRL